MSSNLIISNNKNFSKKINQLKKAGLDSLHVVADFDRTLTSKRTDKKASYTSFSIIRETGHLSKKATSRLKANFRKYSPMENDLTLSNEARIKFMTEWWSRSFDVYIEEAIKRELIQRIVEQNDLNLRDGCSKLLERLETKKIPLLIFSAGVGDVIQHFLEVKQIPLKNIQLIANFLIYDQHGRAVGYRQPLIHSLNKSEALLRDKDYYQELIDRKNVILLGDSLHDPHMTDGLEHDCVLKIGFLNQKVDELLSTYRKLYDVVILRENGFDFVNQLLNEL